MSRFSLLETTVGAAALGVVAVVSLATAEDISQRRASREVTREVLTHIGCDVSYSQVNRVVGEMVADSYGANQSRSGAVGREYRVQCGDYRHEPSFFRKLFNF
jgi:hypothetical protein